MKRLEKLLDAGATQLEVCAALLHRRWMKTPKKITQLRGMDFTMTKPQAPMEQYETIAQHHERHLEQTVTIGAEA